MFAIALQLLRASRTVASRSAHTMLACHVFKPPAMAAAKRAVVGCGPMNWLNSDRCEAVRLFELAQRGQVIGLARPPAFGFV